MKMLPAGLWKKLPLAARDRLSLWWSTLSTKEQREVILLYSQSADKKLLPLGAGSLRLVGRFIDGNEESLSEEHRTTRQKVDLFEANPDKLPAYLSIYEANQADDALSFWSLLEFVSNHEDHGFFLEVRTAHVCRAHREARRVLCQGFLPVNFDCPLSNKACPMRQLLAISPGNSLQLSFLV
jgi:hypothetical protein